MAKTSSAMKRSSAMNAGGGKSITENPQNAISDSERTIAYGLPESEQKDFYYHSGLRRETVDAMEDDIKKNYALTEAITVNESLPKIEAKSEKQSDYAADVRVRALRYEIEAAIKLIPSDKAKKAAVLENARKNFGLQTYSDLVLYLAKNRPSSMWKRIISTTNARDIIDRRWSE